VAYGGAVRIWRVIRRHLDAALALGLFIGLEIELWVAPNIQHRPAVAVAAAVATLPLALRCRFPLASFAAIWAGLWIFKLVSPDFDRNSTFFGIVVVFGLYSLGANARGRRAWFAGVIVVPVLIAAFVSDDGDRFHVGDVAFGALIIGGPWLAGLAIRLRREREHRLEQEKAQAEAAILEERGRIARELHDVIAHAIAVVVVQARGGRRMLDHDPADSRRAFDAIERTGEQALGEMRRLLGLLRESGDELGRAPLPSLERIPELAEQMRASGLPVDVAVEGEPVELPPGVDLSAYRIVQEALTNALKHAGPARARVRIRYGPESLELEVVDDGGGRAGANGTGNGLAGLRERASIVGGELAAGPRAEGGFAVRAALPYDSER
jgi:signal transduction histidine kinase